MDSNVLARPRPSEPLAHVLVAALAVFTIAGVVGSLSGVEYASTLLYWPVALVVAAAAFSLRPGNARRACE